jgi:hypothetical protein
MSYGFVLKDNPQDYVAVSMSIRNEDPLADVRRALLVSSGLTSKLQSASSSPVLNADGQLSGVHEEERLETQRGSDAAPPLLQKLPFYLHADVLPAALLAVVRVCAMTLPELQLCQAGVTGEAVHTASASTFATVAALSTGAGAGAGAGAETVAMLASPASGARPTAVLDTLLRDSQGFPFIRCEHSAITTLLQLLQGKRAGVQLASAALARATFDSDSMMEYRLSCAREYVLGQLSILTRSIDQLSQQLTNLAVRVTGPPKRFLSESEGPQLAAEFGDVAVVTAPGCPSIWRVVRDVAAAHSLASFPTCDVLCRSSIEVCYPAVAAAVDGIEGLDDDVIIAMTLLYIAASKRPCRLKELYGGVLSAVVSASGGSKPRASKRAKTGVDPCEASVASASAFAGGVQSCGCTVDVTAEVEAAASGLLAREHEYGMDQLRDLHADLFPAMSEAFPKLFPEKVCRLPVSVGGNTHLQFVQCADGSCACLDHRYHCHNQLFTLDRFITAVTTVRHLCVPVSGDGPDTICILPSAHRPRASCNGVGNARVCLNEAMTAYCATTVCALSRGTHAVCAASIAS